MAITFRRTLRPKILCLAVAVTLGGHALAQVEDAPATASAVYAASKAGHPELAIRGATRGLEVEPTSASLLEARAFVYRGERRYTEALADYLRLLALDSGSQVGLIGTVNSLRALGAAQLASQYAAHRPDLFSESDRRDLAHREAGALTRLGAADLQRGPTAFDLTDQARTQFEQLATAAQLKEPAFLAGSAGFDYMVAQFNRRNFENVCHSFEALEKAGKPIPDYVVHVAAQSYTSVKNPVRALALLGPIAERNKNDTEFLQSYFYALVDNEQHDKATAMLDAAVARTPAYLGERTPRLRGANPSYIQLVTLAAWSRAFDDRLQAADDYFSAALAEAPANESLRAGLGTVRLWAGRPRDAESAFLQAIALNPKAVEPRRGLVSSYSARGDEVAARAALEVLSTESPTDTQVLRLQADKALRDGPSLSTALGRSVSHIPTGAPAAEFSRRMRFNSGRYRDTWRLFAVAADSRSTPDGAEILQSERALGLEAQLRDLSGSAAVSRKRDGRTGLASSGRWSPADGFTFSGEYESATNDIPARAYVKGTHGTRTSVSAEWQPRVATSISASAARTALSDNNNLVSAGTRWREIWSQSAPAQVWTATAFSTSRASNQDVPYFSPKSSKSVAFTSGISLLESRQSWLGRSRWHHFELELGRVAQAEFKPEGMGAVRYRLNWQWSPKLSAELALERARRVYDGRPEFQNAARFNLNIAL